MGPVRRNMHATWTCVKRLYCSCIGSKGQEKPRIHGEPAPAGLRKGPGMAGVLFVHAWCRNAEEGWWKHSIMVFYTPEDNVVTELKYCRTSCPGRDVDSAPAIPQDAASSAVILELQARGAESKGCQGTPGTWTPASSIFSLEQFLLVLILNIHYN